MNAIAGRKWQQHRGLQAESLKRLAIYGCRLRQVGGRFNDYRVALQHAIEHPRKLGRGPRADERVASGLPPLPRDLERTAPAVGLEQRHVVEPVELAEA